jgi:hypothetical protein
MPLRVERTRPRRPRPAEREILAQLAAKGCNHTATGLQLPARNCTRLHQIAPNCAKQSIGRKTDPMKSILLLSFYFHLIACKVAEASCLLGLESTTAGGRCHLSRLSYASPVQAVREIESGWIQPAPIQLNSTYLAILLTPPTPSCSMQGWLRTIQRRFCKWKSDSPPTHSAVITWPRCAGRKDSSAQVVRGEKRGQQVEAVLSVRPVVTKPP